MKHLLFVAMVSLITLEWTTEFSFAQERNLYELDQSNYDSWVLYDVDCTRVAEIRIHVTPQWAPHQVLSCRQAFGWDGTKRLGIMPGQWIMVRLHHGNWVFLEGTDRRPD